MKICFLSAFFMVATFSKSYAAYIRPGNATSTHTCNSVRGVPSDLRSATYMPPEGLSTFYQKYTEAYGIPVVASASVSDDALRRACYTLRFLLADHSGVRNSYYKLSGRVGVIGASEGTTDIPEHSWLPDWWNERARGLGATESAPISTGGEENILCYSNDRYYNEDIFLHEFSHGVHLLGARYAILEWDSRLKAAYDLANSTGLWTNTYAMSSADEYFAEGTQSYFNVNAYSSTANGIHNHVNTRDKLRTYDPVLYELVEEVFPCGNIYLKRCNTSRESEMNQNLEMSCNENNGSETGGGGDGNKEVTTSTSCTDSNSNCGPWAESGECSKNPAYMLVYCQLSCNSCGTSSCADIVPADCSYWANIGECENNPLYMKEYCKKSCGVC